MALPRKVEGTLNFLERFESMVKEWASDEKKPMTLIAQRSGASLPCVVEAITDALDKPLDVHDPISRKDAEKALCNLKQMLRHEIEARHRQLQNRRTRASEAYSSIMQKIHKLQQSNNWYSAYRTLSYFFGNYASDLKGDAIICICNDSLRLGIKSDVNFQELAQWLQKGIEKCLGLASHDAIEEALDFIDAYGEYFLNEESGKGRIFICSLLKQLKSVAQEPEAFAKFNQVTLDLNVDAKELTLEL